jgi:hypothetical protein
MKHNPTQIPGTVRKMRRRKDSLRLTSNSDQKSMTVEENIIQYEGNTKTKYIRSPTIKIKIKFIKQLLESAA